MFYALHRMVKWACVLLLLAGCYWLWEQRDALEPVWVWYDVYENGGIEKTGPLPVLEGEGIAVLDGHTFQMKTGGSIYSVRLTGFDIPAPPLSNADLVREKQLRGVLKDFVADQKVKVEVTYSNLNSILGVVYVGGTNLNTFFVASGLSPLKQEYIKSVPRDLQYKFFAARRAHEKKQLLALRAE